MSMNSIFLEQNCEYALKNCNFAGATGGNCASEFCNGFPSTSGTCPQIGLDPKNCCGSDDPASCLNDWVHNGGGSGGSGGSGSGSGSTPNPCASVVEIILECSSASPSLFPSQTIFTSGPGATALAGCLCYDSDGTYDPDALDGFASQCVASGQAAHPTYFPYASRLNGFCSSIGPANAVPSTTPAVSTTSAAQATSSAQPLTTSNPTPSSQRGSEPLTPVSSQSITSSPTSSTSQRPASTTTPSGAGKNTLQVGTIILLGAGILLSLY
ncbi:hypothetical protein F5884DRAFT_790462 [Xylogone sp. PMI_703]|nr:hypothetical protein F5884DRAFT_790462 [Xylogone sp. PMI_703]